MFYQQSHQQQTSRASRAIAIVGTLGLAAVTSAQSDCGPWSPLGLGVDGVGSITEVSEMIVFDDGAGPKLYAGGGFTTAGGQTVNHIARWDGSTWAPVGSGLGYGVWAFEVFDDGTGQALYAGGAFRESDGAAGDYMARWTGSDWEPLSTTVDRNVEALQVFDDGTGPALYAAGSFDAAGGQVAYGIARWDGSTWSPVGDGLPGTIRALEVFDNGTGPALYAFGSREPYAHRWDGTQWTGLPGFPFQGLDLEVFDDGAGQDLYAAGPGGVVARLDGDAWTVIRDSVGSGTQVYALHVHDDGTGPALYAGEATGRISRWDGSVWTDLPGFNEEVNSFVTFDDGAGPALYAGGRFTASGEVATSRIAVQRPSCPTIQFVGGSFLVSGNVRADRATGSDSASSGPPSRYFMEAEASVWREAGTPGEQEVYAEFTAGLSAAITPVDDSQVLRILGRVWTYAHTSAGFGSSEASASIATTLASGQEDPIIVEIAEPLQLQIDGASTGSTTSISLLDPTGAPVFEGRVEPGNYELHFGIAESVLQTSPIGALISSGGLDWSFTFSPITCRADLDGDGELTLFDFLAFQNAFDAGDPIADFDGDGSLTLFDFLAFQNEFDAGCA